ncbi:GntR family transcriptional regulator [Micrococcales bacterium 31B]|nr:GntR family transcriptional regulator [Micrococcales bacterium 31B]
MRCRGCGVARPDPIATQVARRIRADIIGGGLAPGTRLTEKLLTERYAVSRMPVREALRALEAEGLVDTRPFAGSSVAASPEEDADDLFDVRLVVEAATARRAAECAAAQLAAGEPDARWWSVRREVSQVLEEGDLRIAEHNFEALAALNMRFHALVADLSGSASLRGVLHQISGRIEWLFAAHVTHRGPSAWSEHREIMRLIDGGDSAGAAALMELHVTLARDGYRKLVGTSNLSLTPDPE